MIGVVAFDFPTWAASYPEFAGLPPSLIAGYFMTAGTICDNTPASIVTDASVGGMRSVLLGVLTAHITALMKPGSSPLVGRINSATEGSVTVQAEMAPATASSAWFMQTKYGALYWQMTSAYRTMRYMPGCARIMDPYAPRWVASQP